MVYLYSVFIKVLLRTILQCVSRSKNDHTKLYISTACKFVVTAIHANKFWDTRTKTFLQKSIETLIHHRLCASIDIKKEVTVATSLRDWSVSVVLINVMSMSATHSSVRRLFELMCRRTELRPLKVEFRQFSRMLDVEAYIEESAVTGKAIAWWLDKHEVPKLRNIVPTKD